MNHASKASRAALCVLCLFGAVQLAACATLDALDGVPQTPSPPLPTPTLHKSASPAPQASSTPIVPDSGWTALRDGMEQRIMNVTGADGEWLESVTILRLDPASFRFDVLYNPGEPKTLSEWRAQSGALLVVNGGFFTEDNEATGLVVSNGQASGSSYEGFGGMFAVTERGPAIRWLPEEPYDPQEPLLAALQSFPMLLTPGGVPGIPADDGQRARRTVVALDEQGRLLFLVSSFGHFTLHGLSRYLDAPDLALDRALNLDGGASSGLLLSDPQLFVPAFEQLPTVIAIYAQ